MRAKNDSGEMVARFGLHQKSVCSLLAWRTRFLLCGFPGISLQMPQHKRLGDRWAVVGNESPAAPAMLTDSLALNWLWGQA